MDKKPSRRSIMAAMGATTTGSFIGVASADGSPGDREIRVIRQRGRKVIERAGATHAELALSAVNEKKVQAIAKRLKRGGWDMIKDKHRSGSVTSTTGESYKFGVIPFESAEKPVTQAAILWKQDETREWDVKGYLYNNADGKSAENGILTATSEMSVQENEYEDNLTIQGSCSCLDPGGGNGNCVFFSDTYCDDFNLTCILWVIGAIGLSCGAAGPIGCLAGTSVALGPYLSGDGCEICDEYAEEDVVLC